MTDIDVPHGPVPAPAPSSAYSDQRSPVDLSAIPTAAWEHWGELIRDIGATRDTYYNAVDAESPLSNVGYDTLCWELEGLEAAHPLLARVGSPTRSVGGCTVADFTPAPHHECIYSLQGVSSLDEVQEQAEYMVAETRVGDDELTMTVEVKIGGLAVTLTYEDDILTRTATRGDGTTGEDVTSNIRAIASVPLVLAGDIHLSLLEMRGRVYFLTQDFEAFNEERRIRSVQRQADSALLLQVFASLCDTAAGSLRRKNPAITISRPLAITAYGVGTITPAPGENLPTRQHE